MPATVYTRATLTAEIQAELDDESGVYYTATRVHKAINNRLAEFCLRTQCRRYTWRKDLVADMTIIDLTTLTPRVIDVQDVALPTSAGAEEEFSLPAVSMEWLNANFPNWRTQVSNWPQRYTRFTEGFDGLVLHPAPASSQSAIIRDGTLYADLEVGALLDLLGVGTAEATAEIGALVNVEFLVGNLRIDGIAHSTDLALDADTVETGGVPVQYQQAIKAGALADLCRMGVPISQQNKAPGYLADFEAAVAKAQRLVKNSFQSKPAQYQRGSNF